MSTSVLDYVQKNLRDINFFTFARNFKYQKTEENLAWSHYLSALGILSNASDNEIRTYAKRRKEEAMVSWAFAYIFCYNPILKFRFFFSQSLKLRKGQLENFWLNVEIENAQASFETGMRCIQVLKFFDSLVITSSFY